ncbi:hypothetical protein PF005_g23654 [Phytophthora fragariae]|uniref:Uncharacterized protein n=1 Tax=Phytophthora fragariae TaxID=53985 RepID=A0A6A3WZ79_9STRA|nr:hypothetical protein PF003_g4231 [Phytophthora fragariae]KAE8926173.1 hypothetical protein PF009_g23635 [Phytophthora fragariae]KAE8976548.1 hypothetical protein PF011_g24004 [Phytophthora fragariae]KAE9072486.1 hypothetical protein PF010_g25464 [Phytophthora fragariae]KAE9078987.1 hypothetical protein PF007_g23624 [Phytophthora fragariae]
MSDNGDQDKLLRLLVDKFVKSDKTAHCTTQKMTQFAFWRNMRQALAANEASSGLEVLDDIAEAILDETGKAEDAFSGPILLLPKPTRMRESKGAPNINASPPTCPRVLLTNCWCPRWTSSVYSRIASW